MRKVRGILSISPRRRSSFDEDEDDGPLVVSIAAVMSVTEHVEMQGSLLMLLLWLAAAAVAVVADDADCAPRCVTLTLFNGGTDVLDVDVGGAETSCVPTILLM